ncbi:MAG: NFACT family protein [Clostridiales bacterium]|nr:NFACT family protein [Clostridiales bacterium]
MPCDALHYYYLVKEFNLLLCRGKIEKVQCLNDYDIVLHIRASNKNYPLLLSGSPNQSCMYLTEQKFESQKVATAFCLNLKKNITNSVIVKFDTVPYERIIEIHFEHIDEFGTKNEFVLVAELMGRRSNIILITKQTGKICECMFKASIDIAPKRPILPGMSYSLPLAPNYEILQRIKKQFEMCEKIPYSPSVAIKDNVSIDFFINKSLMENQMNFDILNFKTLNQAVCFHYKSQSEYKAFSSLKYKLATAINNAQKKLAKKQWILLKSRQQSSDFANFQLLGELLTANMYLAKYGDKSVTVTNYYDETDVTIILDVKKNPAQNAQHYFKQYSKKLKTYDMTGTQLTQVEDDLQYFQSIQALIEAASDMQSLMDIKQEMAKASIYLKKENENHKNEPQMSKPRHYEIDGFDVFLGKNNIQNDQLIKNSKSSDIWLHQQNAHGCHAIISTHSKLPSLQTITKVAEIVAFFSKSKQTDKVFVDYTQIKNVTKRKGAKPGFVLYKNQKTLCVNPKNPMQ